MAFSGKLNDREGAVLACLKDAHDGMGGFSYLAFAPIQAETGLTRKDVRRACRSLTRKGLAEFGSGLWTEVGYPAGSGYSYAGEDTK